MLKMFLFYHIVFVVLIVNVQTVSIERNENYEVEEEDHKKLLSRRRFNKENGEERVLSRTRRYLTFPEGSSMQLVYDQIIGMVDTTNLHIFGITCSLAWQLPHKSFFADEHTEAPMHNSKISISDIGSKSDKIDSPQNTGHVYHFDTYYNRSNYHSHKVDNGYFDYLKAKPKVNKPPSIRFDDWQKYYTNKLKWNYSHDVYPALRMRRHISNHKDKLNGSRLHPEVKKSLQHHRDTRFNLYKSIEKYLNAKGENGEQCIKLAICETNQIERMSDKHKSNEPDSFVKELLRVVFSLPSVNFHSDTKDQSTKYDNILNEIDYNNSIDCYSKYPDCSTSIWSNSFIF